MKSNSAAWFLSGALAVALLTTNLASASPETTTITGCLTSKGSLTKVSAGATPLKACGKGETQVSWSSGAPNVAITTATLGDAPAGAARALALGDNVVITPTSVTWTIDDSTDATPCTGDGDRSCFVASVPYDAGTPVASATAQAILVEGVVDAPSAEGMEELGATECFWTVRVAPDSAVTDSDLWFGYRSSDLVMGEGKGEMGPLQDQEFHRMVFLGSNPGSRLEIELLCYDGYGDISDPSNVQLLPGVADFDAPFVISDLSVKVITFGPAN